MYSLHGFVFFVMNTDDHLLTVYRVAMNCIHSMKMTFDWTVPVVPMSLIVSWLLTAVSLIVSWLTEFWTTELEKLIDSGGQCTTTSFIPTSVFWVLLGAAVVVLLCIFIKCYLELRKRITTKRDFVGWLNCCKRKSRNREYAKRGLEDWYGIGGMPGDLRESMLHDGTVESSSCMAKMKSILCCDVIAAAWNAKEIYIAPFLHLFDTASDVATVVEFGILAFTATKAECSYDFFLGIFTKSLLV